MEWRLGTRAGLDRAQPRPAGVAELFGPWVASAFLEDSTGRVVRRRRRGSWPNFRVVSVCPCCPWAGHIPKIMRDSRLRVKAPGHHP